jgi:hypothetical protein
MTRRISIAMISLTLVGAMTAGVAAADQASLSKPDYIKAADDICAQSTQLIDELGEQHFGDLAADQEPTADQIAAYLEDIQPIWEQELNSLRGLPKPTVGAKKVKTLLKLLEKAFDKVADDPSLLLSDDDPFAKPDRLAVKYGFKVCGSDD